MQSARTEVQNIIIQYYYYVDWAVKRTINTVQAFVFVKRHNSVILCYTVVCKPGSLWRSAQTVTAGLVPPGAPESPLGDSE